MKQNTLIIRSEIHGVRVDLEVDDSEVYGWLSEYLSGFPADEESPAKINFIIRVRPDDPMSVPEEAEWFLHYHGLAGLTLDRFFYFRAFDSVFRFDPENNLVEATVTDELLQHRRCLTHVVFTVVLFETLRYHGLYYIHGAALLSPAGEGVLIPANASSGKSTLSVALLHHGYNYVSDDAVFARWRDDNVELIPFVREFHVSPRLIQLFKELKFLEDEPEYFPGNDKRAFRGEDIYPGRFLGIMGSPEVVLFPEIVRDRESSVIPLDTHQALTRMIRNSALVMFSLPAAKSHLDALKSITSKARCFLLKSGADVYEAPVEAVERIIKKVDL